MYILLCYVTYNCTVHWADLIYVSLLIIFCIIEYLTNKTLNPCIMTMYNFKTGTNKIDIELELSFTLSLGSVGTHYEII